MRKLFLSLHGYRRSWLKGDLIASLTVWAILVPESLAYASIAGVSPVIGLYAAPGALIFYAALGSSRKLVTGPMSATAALSAATVAALVPTGGDRYVAMTAALAITTGLLALAAGLLRLGFLASLISEPVIKGFIVGLALTIIVGQVPKLFGIPKGSGDFFQQLAHVITHLGDTNVATLVVGVLSLAAILALRRLAPIVPAALVVVILGILAVKLFSLQRHGVAIVGPIPSGLPSLGVPNVHLKDFGALVAGAAGVMLVGFAEGLGAAKNYAAREHEPVDANRELLGLGAANIAAGLSSGMVVNGSLSKTAVNDAAGARSQLSGLVVAAMTIVTLLVLTGLFQDLPEATLAAIVIAALIDLVDIPELVNLYHAYSPQLGRHYGFVARPDFIAAVAALLGVIVFDTLPGLFIGILVSFVLLSYRASRPYIARLGLEPGPDAHYEDLDRHPEARPVDHVAVLRIEGGLYFANADSVQRRITQAAAAPGTRAVVLDTETVPFIDVTAARMLVALEDDLEHHEVRLLISRGVGQVRDILRNVVDDPDHFEFFPSVAAAVEAAARPEPGDAKPAGR